MLGRQQEINLQLSQVLDSILIALAFWLCHSAVYYDWLPWIGNPGIPAFREFFWLMAIAVPFTPIVLEFQGYYENSLYKSPARSISQMFRALVIVGVIIGACVVFFKWGAKSRAVLGILPIVAGSLLLIKEGIIRTYTRRLAKRGGLRERVLLAGEASDVEKLAERLEQELPHTMMIVGRVDLTQQPVSDLVDYLHEHSVERVIFTAGHVHFGKVQEAISACEIEGVEAWLSTHFLQTNIARPTFDVIAGRLMMVFSSTPDASWQLVLKDVIDRVGATLLIIATSPFWLLAAIGIKLSSKGPIFFKQERSGKHGKPFTMYKFRTMYVDAEERQKELEEENQMSGPVFKIDGDPRIFWFGNYLRKFSIDELPQLLNVVLGQMSLVGPRPLPVYEVERIEKTSQRRRLSVKPGLTCTWQVQGRNRITDFDEWVKLDLQYIDNWSIWLDLKLIALTIPAVLMGVGAK
ncbi:MAG: sugar transferase [Verrucomicrobiota bacterium]